MRCPLGNSMLFDLHAFILIKNVEFNGFRLQVECILCSNFIIVCAHAYLCVFVYDPFYFFFNLMNGRVKLAVVLTQVGFLPVLHTLCICASSPGENGIDAKGLSCMTTFMHVLGFLFPRDWQSKFARIIQICAGVVFSWPFFLWHQGGNRELCQHKTYLSFSWCMVHVFIRNRCWAFTEHLRSRLISTQSW